MLDDAARRGARIKTAHKYLKQRRPLSRAYGTKDIRPVRMAGNGRIREGAGGRDVAAKGGDSFSDIGSGKRAGSKKRGWKKKVLSILVDRIERGLVAARRTIFMTILTFSLSGK